jgi:endonuclease YncB( thermonuclease family)
MYPHRIQHLKILFITILVIPLSISLSISQTLKCTKVIDGDTILLSNGKKSAYKVDTPETKPSHKAIEPFGERTTASKKMVEEEKTSYPEIAHRYTI